MKAINLTKDTVLAKDLIVADNFWQRFKGLMGRDRLPAGCGLHLLPCSGIHTFGMKFSLDVLYLDYKLEVIYLLENIKPYSKGPLLKAAKSVLELPVGTISRCNIELSDKIGFEGGYDRG